MTTAAEEEIDETAELYEPEAEVEPEPEPGAEDRRSQRRSPCPSRSAARRAPRRARRAGKQGQGGVHAPPRSQRHLKLRLACAVDGRSAQQLVTDALDQLLERMPELDGLAAKAKRKG